MSVQNRVFAFALVALVLALPALAQPRLSQGDERGSFQFNEGNDTGADTGGGGGSASQ
jgi:hypothetical protein